MDKRFNPQVSLLPYHFVSPTLMHVVYVAPTVVNPSPAPTLQLLSGSLWSTSVAPPHAAPLPDVGADPVDVAAHRARPQPLPAGQEGRRQPRHEYIHW